MQRPARSSFRTNLASLAVALAVLAAPAALPAGVWNGDVNGNGSRGIDDAICLLGYLFQHGTPPASLAVDPGVPSTGQTQFWGTLGQIQMPAPGEPFHGQDATYGSGIAGDFEVIAPDPADKSTWYTVDHSTGLMWQYINDGQRRTWPEAFAYASALRLGGLDDWRVPNVTELVSLIRYDRGQPAFDTDAFGYMIQEPFYHTFTTSTTPAANRSECFVVSVKLGAIYFSPKDPGYKPEYVRCVRTIRETGPNGDVNGDQRVDLSDAISLLLYLFRNDDPPVLYSGARGLPVTYHCCVVDDPPCVPDPAEPECLIQTASDREGVPREFELVKPDPADETTWYTIDHAVGLMWQYAEPLEMKTWEEALAYCEALQLGPFDDWRLPTVKELQSTINYGKAYPAIDREYFGTKSYALEGRDNWQFWSSTAWYTVDVDIGLIADLTPTSSYWVRAVRSVTPE